MTVQWSGNNEVRANIEAYGEEVKAIMRRIAQYWQIPLENYAKSNRPWHDQTNAARVTLAAYLGDAPPPKSTEFEQTVEYPTPEQISEDIVTLYLSHGVEYGVQLETGYSGRYAIIWPTIEAHLPEISRMLKEVFG